MNRGCGRRLLVPRRHGVAKDFHAEYWCRPPQAGTSVEYRLLRCRYQTWKAYWDHFRNGEDPAAHDHPIPKEIPRRRWRATPEPQGCLTYRKRWRHIFLPPSEQTRTGVRSFVLLSGFHLRQSGIALFGQELSGGSRPRIVIALLFLRPKDTTLQPLGVCG